MTTQQHLFDEPPKPSTNGIVPLNRYQGAMVFSAIGDALGWPTEFLREGGRRPSFALPLTDFTRWDKLVGGRWWGYRDQISPGDYSDDTQLTLAVARCISGTGEFEPEPFAYSELPLWLHYERGGGKSMKAAARTLIQRKSDWLHNYYKQGQLDYHTAGANGAAMRTLPIALASALDEKRLIRDSFLNAIITHGHPRAILGALLFGLAVRYALLEPHDIRGRHLVDYLQQKIENAGRLVADEPRIGSWVEGWEKRKDAKTGAFKAEFGKAREEVRDYLSEACRQIAEKSPADYYRYIGALAPETKGSGVATVCAALYLFCRFSERPDEAIYGAVNMLGSDTDTISSFLGALLGARHGLSAVPPHLLNKVQDREYLLVTAERLHAIANSQPSDQVAEGEPIHRDEAYLRILAWEIGLHEMFWDAIDIGGEVVHPTLGRGRIGDKHVRQIAKAGYLAKLISIKFDCGQSCIFHSRVQDKDGRVSESIAEDVAKALGVR